MSESRLDLKQVYKPEPKNSNVNQAILFILPSIVITIISILLFGQLNVFPEPNHNIFLVTVISAIILSLVGMAGMQMLMYRIIDDRDHYIDGTAIRAIKMGLIYSCTVSIILAAIISPFLLNVLHFSITDFLYFALLLFLFSSTWIIISAFWAAERFKYPAIIFTIAYIVIFGFTYTAYRINSVYTLTGYILGTTTLLLLSFFTAIRVFPKPRLDHALSSDFSKLPKIISLNNAPILFNIFYVLAIFLDKIIVWVNQGLQTGQGLVVTGNYTTAAFLGLIPLFSIAVVAYFTSRTKSIVQDRYKGTFSEIQKGLKEYERIYRTSLGAMLLIAMLLTILAVISGYVLTGNTQILQILLTIAMGSICFSVIIFNSTVLVIFGKGSISAIAVLKIVIAELITIPFVRYEIWYASLGFLVGSFVGSIVSLSVTLQMLSRFEYKMFRLLLKPQ